jgi:hypothetical protein
MRLKDLLRLEPNMRQVSSFCALNFAIYSECIFLRRKNCFQVYAIKEEAIEQEGTDGLPSIKNESFPSLSCPDKDSYMCKHLLSVVFIFTLQLYFVHMIV